MRVRWLLSVILLSSAWGLEAASAEEAATGSSVPVDTSAPAQTVKDPMPAKEPPATGPDEYEIDYEEEPAEPAVPAAPAKKALRSGGIPAVQGSRAKDRFTPILKSETKSVYKKGGKSLDVDPD